MLRNLVNENGDISDEPECNLSSKLGGMLTFEDGNDTANSPHSGSNSLLSFESESSVSSSTNCAPVENKKSIGTRVIFEIVSAKTVTNLGKKHVAYTLLIKRSPGLDQFPAVVERRYSEFLELYLNLKRNYPEEMQPVNYFPKKTVIGNFKSEVIVARSRSFEQFLYHIYNTDQLRLSAYVADFFYNRETKLARGSMKRGQFEDAIPLLENAYFLQEKLLGEDDIETLSTLCEVTALHNAIDNTSEAHKFAEIALKSFQSGHHENSEYYPSLLQLTIRLCWNLGKEKRDLESQIQKLNTDGVKTDNLPTLLDIVMKKCK